MADVIAEGIEVDPSRCHGKPVIAGTRVLVSTVLGCLAAGDSPARIADSYGITEQDIRAAIAFANRLVGDWDHVGARTIRTPKLAHPDAAADFRMEVT
ncbi:MAG: DUF433 domain-containing protein [Phycisphaerales bacterium]|nr:DUF433 domain-containing protein [Phycisphaerales bacterium]